ncbi:MAG: PD-(D/E)XK nuclease family protein [Bacilli bacterium]|nr:PD-(D/E)XK nuclease family protein [Bacilli bacterium]
MLECLQEKCILICDFELTPLVFKCKSAFPDASWKILTKDELLDRLSFSFAKDPIPYLLSLGIDYGSAKKYVRLLRLAAVEKHPKLLSLYQDLEAKGYFRQDDLGALEISRSPLLLLEMEEDQELHAFLRRKGIPSTDITLEDLGAKKKRPDDEPPAISSFPNKFLQYFYIYSAIRKSLLEDESAKEKTTVLINDESDLYYVKLASSLFKIPSYATFLRPFLSIPEVKKKTTDIYREKSFAFSEEELGDPSLEELRNIISYYGLASLPFEFAYASLLEIANASGIKEEIDDRGITVENRFVLDPDARIYVTNFQYGSFYKVYDDKNVFTDEELVAIEANPSYVATKLDRRKKLNYLRYNDIALLSRVRQHLTDKIYDSQLIEELGWDKRAIHKTEWNEDGVFTSDAGRLYLAGQFDRQFYPFAYQDYRGYDHSFQGVGRPIFSPKKNWSITDLESYRRCPYKYYLSKVLPSENLGTHVMWLGTLIHKVLENVLSPGFDFESAFALGVEEYRKSMERSNAIFGPKEEVWLEISKIWLREFVASIAKAKGAMHFVKETPEQKITFTLQGSNGNLYTFANAKIDKVLVTEFGGDKYYTIIDYKSGKETFEAELTFLGQSSQLPLYYYAIEHSPSSRYLTENGMFGGFMIIHSFADSPSKVFADKSGALKRENLLGYTASKGLTRVSSSYWHSLDETAFKKDGSIRAGGGNYVKRDVDFVQVDGVGENLVPNSLPEGYNLSALIEDAKQGLVTMIEAILRNDFPIAPTTSDLQAGDFGFFPCSNCPYADICYHSGRDKKSYRQEIEEHFYGKQLLRDDEEEGADE